METNRWETKMTDLIEHTEKPTRNTTHENQMKTEHTCDIS